MSDLWELQLDHLNMTEGATADEDRSDQCDWRLQTGSTADRVWQDTCGGTQASGKTCDPREVLLRAWCSKDWQSFSNH